MGLHTESPPEQVVHVLGVRFNNLLRKQVVEKILHWIAEQSRRMVITAGPEFVMKTREDLELKQIVYVADLVTPDGIGVIWAANRAGHHIRERVTGVDLVRELLDTVEQRNQPLRVYMLGASEESLSRCLQIFRETYPKCVFEGRNGYFQDQDLPTILAEIESFAPHLWLVGLGQPRQEKLIYHALAGLPPCVAIGVGGSIDVWSGTLKRAPGVFQKMNLEWLYRLIRQPQRLRRQLELPRFVWQVLRKSE